MKKRILATLLTMALAISLVACGGKKNNIPEEPETEESSDKVIDEVDTQQDDLNEAGFKEVEKINIDTDEITLKYTGHEILDDSVLEDDGETQRPIKELIVYFDYTNKTSVGSRIFEAVQTEAYQNGISLTNWMGTSYDEENEALGNSYKEIMDGATLNVALAYELEDAENQVKLRVDNSAITYQLNGDEEIQSQEMIINLK